MEQLSPWISCGEQPFLTSLPASTVDVVNSLQDGVYITDLTDRVLLWNQTARTLTGFSAEDVVGRCYGHQLFSHAGHLELSLPVAHSHPERVCVHSYARHRAGHTVPVALNVSSIGDGHGGLAGLFVVFWDRSQEVEFCPESGQQIAELLKHYVSREAYEMARLNACGMNQGDCVPCEITAMFVDIVQFTAFAEEEGAEAARGLLNEFFALCEACVLQNRGDVDKLIGDCAMAIFHHADDAVSAGREILRELATRNRRKRAQGARELHVRIGMHSGQAVRGDVGGASRKDCTVIGDAVNTAARLQSIGDVDAMLISEDTYSRLREPDGFDFVGTTRIRGRLGTLRLYVG